MARYVGKRLLWMLAIAVGISFIIFTIMDLTQEPEDPATIILGPDATQEAVVELTEELGLYDPFFVRYGRYIKNIVTKLDFGNSYRTGKPVFTDILPKVPISFKLAVVCMVWACILGIPLGVWSAIHQYSVGDQIMRVLSMLIVAIPSFWFAMVMMIFFALQLKILPSSGSYSWQCYILPMLTLGTSYGCRFLRITRSTMLEVTRQDYITTAKAKGVPQRIITYKHALHNALLPIITSVGTSFGGLLGGAIIIESVFNMNGLGALIVLSIKQKDTPIVMASVILLAVWFSLVMLIVDLIYAFIDPRIKAKYTSKSKKTA